MKRYAELMKIIVITIMAILVCTGTLYCQDSALIYQSPELADIASSIQSPEELSSWLSKNFHYEMKFPDKPQPIANLLASKIGDCDDLANLSAQILSNMNIENKVLVIKFKGISIRHAVCIFRGNDGNYNFMSNRNLIYTKQASIKSAIAAIYPDCESYEEVKA